MSSVALLFLATSSVFQLPPGLLDSVCYVESKHSPSAIHPHDGAGASLGICQIHLSVARSLGFTGNEQDLMDPERNIHYAGQYLQVQYARYHSWPRAVCAYNRGKSTGDGWNRYTRAVWKRWADANGEGQSRQRKITPRTTVCPPLPGIPLGVLRQSVRRAGDVRAQ